MYIPRQIKKPIKYVFKILRIRQGEMLNLMSVEERRRRLEEQWKRIYGTELDLDNPITFTQKLQWAKLYYHNKNLWRCVDKSEFKRYIKEKIGDGYTAKLIQEWHRPSQVSLKKLPKSFVLKSNCQSDGNFIVIVKDKEKVDTKKIEKEIKETWFEPRNLLINSFCSAYYKVKPKVIVEEYLEQFDGQLNDYKLFCFSGKPEFFYVATEHYDNGINKSDYPISFYSLDWVDLGVRYGNHAEYKCAPRPKHIEEMIEIARKLSADFPFVRVDFFDTEEKLYLAELTFYPGGGWTPYYPESFDVEMGNKYRITNKTI